MRDCQKICGGQGWAGAPDAIISFNAQAAAAAGYRWSTAPAGVRTEALVLSCLDPRLLGSLRDYLGRRSLDRRYDHLALPGGAIGALAGADMGWGHAFWDYLDIAVNLHSVRRVIAVDHCDCTLYAGSCPVDGPHAARMARTRHLMMLEDEILERYPDVTVELLLMDRTGKVRVLS